MNKKNNFSNAQMKKLLENMLPGTSTIARVITKDKGDVAPHLQTCFICREEDWRIKQWPTPCPVCSKVGLLNQDNCAVVVSMIQFPTATYENYLNFHYVPDVPEFFEDLTIQNHITFLFYGDDLELKRRIRVPNSLKKFFKNAINKIKSVPKWSMKDFDNAKEKIQQKYPVDELWEKLESLSVV